MKKPFDLSGTVVYENLEMGFWGIIDIKGRKWRPVNMPEQLKTKGKKVSVTAIEIEEEFSIYMWGTPISILSFGT